MILPFKGSPWRPIYISVLLCGFLGLIFSGIGVLALVALGINGIHRGKNPLVILGGFFLYGGIGFFYFFCAYWLNRLRMCAAIVALSITSIGLLIVLAISVYGTVAMLRGRVGDPELWFLFGAIWFIELMVIATLSLLIRELILCFRAIDVLLHGQGRGFEVMPIE